MFLLYWPGSDLVCMCVDVVDHIVVGTVIQEVKTSNLAREVRTRSIIHAFPGLRPVLPNFMLELSNDMFYKKCKLGKILTDHKKNVSLKRYTLYTLPFHGCM